MVVNLFSPGQFKSIWRIAWVSLAAWLLAACAPPAVSTPDPGLIETIVAATVQALPTNTPPPSATASPEPTRTRPAPTETATEAPPMPTLTPLPTLTPIPTQTQVPTATSPGGAEIGRIQGDANFACVVLSQNPPDGFQASPGQDIPVSWRIQNVGKRDWEGHNMDYGYVSGNKMSIGGELFDLGQDIKTTQTGEIVVVFEAPKKSGDFKTTWALFRGKTAFCEFSFSLTVK
jgi:hypothetical protein